MKALVRLSSAGLVAVFMGLSACARQVEASPVAAFDMSRCVNMGNSLEAPANGEWGVPLHLEDFAHIHAAGFDTVRIPVRWSDYTEPDGAFVIRPDFMTEVQTAVDTALAQNLNVILNVHHFEEMMADPRGEMARFLAIWEQISAAFSEAPSDLWFEILNEPNGTLKGRWLQAAQRDAVDVIRRTNADRVIILGGEDWSNVDTLNTNIGPPDKNIVYTFHYYDPFAFTHQNAPWTGPGGPKETRGWGSKADKAELAKAVETASQFQTQIGRPVFMGEFGVYEAAEDGERVKWTGAVRDAMEEAGIPWCLWSFSNSFALYDRAAGWDADMMAVLGMDLSEDLSADAE